MIAVSRETKLWVSIVVSVAMVSPNPRLVVASGFVPCETNTGPADHV